MSSISHKDANTAQSLSLPTPAAAPPQAKPMLSRSNSVSSVASSAQSFVTAPDGFGEQDAAPSPTASPLGQNMPAPSPAPSPAAMQNAAGVKLATANVSTTASRPATPTQPAPGRAFAPAPSVVSEPEETQAKQSASAAESEVRPESSPPPSYPQSVKSRAASVASQPSAAPETHTASAPLAIKALRATVFALRAVQAFCQRPLVKKAFYFAAAVAPLIIYASLAAVPGGIFAFGIVLLLIPPIAVASYTYKQHAHAWVKAALGE